MEYTEHGLAKLNLTLRVLDIREDGYNNIKALTLFCRDIYDVLTLTNIKDLEKDLLTVGGNSTVEKNLDVGNDNLILKATEIFKRNLVDEIDMESNNSKNFKIVVEKHIPSGAGLGGGSADGAAILRELNKIYESRFTIDELLDLAMLLGSDVGACLYSQALWMTQRGGTIELIQNEDNSLDFLSGYKTLIITPDIFCPTPEIYQHYDLIGRPTHEGIEVPQDFLMLTDNFHNDLEISALDKYDDLKEFKNHIEKITNEKFLLAGSGSSIFCILDVEKAESSYEKLLIQLENELIHEKIRQLAVSAIC